MMMGKITMTTVTMMLIVIVMTMMLTILLLLMIIIVTIVAMITTTIVVIHRAFQFDHSALITKGWVPGAYTHARTHVRTQA